MDQTIVAVFALINLFAFIAGYYIGGAERRSRGLIHKPADHDTIETRSRRAF